MASATSPTCGFASMPIPTATPAARTEAPLLRSTARIASQPSTVVLSMSKVVVVTKWPTASAKPETAVHRAATTCARALPPTSRATSAASTVVAAAASADGVRSTSSEPGAMECIAQRDQWHDRRLVGIAERGVRPGDDEVHLVAVVAVAAACNQEDDELGRGDGADPTAQACSRWPLQDSA